MSSAPFPWIRPLTPWQRFRRDPTTYLAQWLYRRKVEYVASSPLSPQSPVCVVCVSDTHCTQPSVPDGDVLLHAGDLSKNGTFEELQAQLDWLKAMPHKYKVVIGGNHDLLLDPDFISRFPERICEGEGTSRSDLNWGDIIYLNNCHVTLELPDGGSLKVYGSPLTDQFGTWAFQYPPIRDVWTDSIPTDTDILLTHGPPKGHLDLGDKGSGYLLKEIWRKRPRLVVFGHIHAGHGREDIKYDAVQAAYDGVILGEKGFPSVLYMALQLFFQRLWDMLPLPEVGPSLVCTTMVNAAVVGGPTNEDRRPAVVIHM